MDRRVCSPAGWLAGCRLAAGQRTSTSATEEEEWKYYAERGFCLLLATHPTLRQPRSDNLPYQGELRIVHRTKMAVGLLLLLLPLLLASVAFPSPSFGLDSNEIPSLVVAQLQEQNFLLDGYFRDFKERHGRLALFCLCLFCLHASPFHNLSTYAPLKKTVLVMFIL